MGVIQPGDVSEQILILKNISLFDIKFRIFLDSLKDQVLANNRNGRVLFDCSPAFGSVGSNEEIKLKVKFTPDHASIFKDILQVRLFGKDYDTGDDRQYPMKSLWRKCVFQNIFAPQGPALDI